MARQGILALAAFVFLLGGCAASGEHAELKEGWNLMVANEYAAARDHYQAMLVEYPDNPYALLNLGVAYEELGNIDLAKEHYEAALAAGENAEIAEVAEKGKVAAKPTTVAVVARANLERLPE